MTEEAGGNSAAPSVAPRDTVDGGLARHLAGQPSTADLTPEQAKATYAAMRADPDFIKALSDKHHPTHQMASQRRQELFARMYPADPQQGGDSAASDAESDAPPAEDAQFQPGADPEAYGEVVKATADGDIPAELYNEEMAAASAAAFHRAEVSLADAKLLSTYVNGLAAKPMDAEMSDTLWARAQDKYIGEWGGREAFESRMRAIGDYVREIAGNDLPQIKAALIDSGAICSPVILGLIDRHMKSKGR